MPLVPYPVATAPGTDLNVGLLTQILRRGRDTKKLIDEIALLFYYPLQHWKGGDPKAYEFKSQ
jgi:hypothetical protein